MENQQVLFRSTNVEIIKTHPENDATLSEWVFLGLMLLNYSDEIMHEGKISCELWMKRVGK